MGTDEDVEKMRNDIRLIVPDEGARKGLYLRWKDETAYAGKPQDMDAIAWASFKGFIESEYEVVEGEVENVAEGNGSFGDGIDTDINSIPSADEQEEIKQNELMESE